MNWQTSYPAIVEMLGHDWLYRMAGRLTDTELARQETFSHKLWIARDHESECEAAALAILTERKRAKATT